MSRQSLQNFELHVLLALVREGKETYSVPLVIALEKRMERAVSQAAVFIALGRLERKGLVRSRLDDGRGARPRRYFTITRDGLDAVDAHRAEHARLWHGVGRVLKARKA